MERPLDTIRSFESAIDSSYTRRYSAQPGRHHPLLPHEARALPVLYGSVISRARFILVLDQIMRRV